MIGHELITWHSSQFDRVREAWDYLVSVDPQAPLFHYRQWFELADEAGAINPWGVLLIHARRPIALFPICRRFPGSLEVISCFGQGEMQVVIDPAYEEHAWRGVAEWMTQHSTVGLLSLGISEQRQRIDLIVSACRRRQLAVVVKPYPTAAVWSDVPASWEAFLDTIGATAARNIYRAEQHLEELGADCTIEFLTDPDACAMLVPEMIKLYRLRWAGHMSETVFDDPRNICFYQRAVRWAAEQGHALLTVIRLHDEPILIQTHFMMPGQGALYLHYTARDILALPRNYSPGIAASAGDFRWAIDHGLTRVNQGPVAMPYKMLFGGVEHPRWQLAIAQSPAAYRVLSRLNRGSQVIPHLPKITAYLIRQALQRLRPGE